MEPFEALFPEILKKSGTKRKRMPNRNGRGGSFGTYILRFRSYKCKINDLENPKKYQKLVTAGNKIQMKVLEDYIEHSPKDFHY